MNGIDGKKIPEQKTQNGNQNGDSSKEKVSDGKNPSKENGLSNTSRSKQVTIDTAPPQETTKAKAEDSKGSPELPPPKSENTPLPTPPMNSKISPTTATPKMSQCSDTGSPSGKEQLKTRRSWSVSDLALAVSKSVGTIAAKAKKFFREKKLESPDVAENEREAAEAQRKNDWNKLLKRKLSRSQMSNNRQVERLCWKGIPGSIRGSAWKAIIGNDLKITPELFKINLKRGKKLWKEQVLDSSTKVKDEDDDEGSREDSMRIIQADIPRTFPQLKFFHQEGPFHEPLLQILQSYVCYRPDVGYVQGMSYLAAILLLNMNTLDSFVCLANLLNQDIYFAFFRMDVDKMQTHLRVYQALMKEKLPNLYQHFETLEIRPGMYLYEWLLTIYSRSLKLDIAHRIWDNFLFHGQVFLFRTALGMLRMYESKFLKMNFEDCLSILNRPPEKINEKILFDNIYKIQLTSKRFDKMVAKYMEEDRKNRKNKIRGDRKQL
mmetsp:Transcript_17980/g.26949  ORF Transcript_17980/g.26949 Transcript_17980/m.26949 type:complete len:491 (+) Transcript_17980:102-1574(+)